MSRLAIFRVLLVLFVLCYGARLYSPAAVDLSRFPDLRAYLEDVDALYGGFRPDLMWFVLLWMLGHLVEVVGLVLLFCRVCLGLWPACVGAALSAGTTWFVIQREPGPIIQSNTDHLLWAMTCILWGGYVCMALTDRQNIFEPSPKAG